MLQRIDFSALARRLMRERSYTTARLGEAVGLSQPSVSRLATGQTQSVSAEVGIALIRLAGGTVELPLLPDEPTDAPISQAGELDAV